MARVICVVMTTKVSAILCANNKKEKIRLKMKRTKKDESDV